MRHSSAGYSFVEVLVAIAILLISIMGPLTIASTGLQNAQFAREQNVAFFLAQEGIEGVVYLREKAGLDNFPSGTNTWSWVNALPAACRSGSPCRLDVENHTLAECDPVSECDLRLHTSGSVRYRHDAGGEATPYNRTITVEPVNGYTVRVRSTVSWDSSAFSAERSVVLETYLTDIYKQ